MQLSAAEIMKITAYLDATTPLPEKAGLIFVTGTRLETPAVRAAELFQKGIAPYIVVTGGGNRYTGEGEALAHRAILLEHNIPPERIIVEGRSSNTLENVTFALPLIQEKMDLAALESILVIAKWMHSRRVLMTLKRQLQQPVRYYASTYQPKGITQENWHSDPRSASANVLKEWENIARYLQWNHLTEITRDGDAFV